MYGCMQTTTFLTLTATLARRETQPSLALTDHGEGRYCHIYMDKFFLSVILYKHLLDDGTCTYCMGTFQQITGIPPDLRACKVKGKLQCTVHVYGGEVEGKPDGHCLAGQMASDIFVSTAHSPNQTEVIKRTDEEKEGGYRRSN